MKTTKGFAPLILIIILAIAAVGGGVYYKVHKGTQSKSSVENASVATSTDETTTWKRYTDASSGISFQYPQAWGEPKLAMLSTRIAGSFPDGSIGKYDNGFSFEVGTHYDQIDGRNVTIDEIISGLKTQPYIKSLNEKSIKLDNKTATQIEYTYKTGGKVTEIYIPLDSKGTFFEIASDVNTIGAETFNKVLASISFNWKTYTNSEEGFSIKYPNNWFIIESERGLVSVANYSLENLKAYQVAHGNKNPEDFMDVDIVVETLHKDMTLKEYFNGGNGDYITYDVSQDIIIGDNIAATKLIYKDPNTEDNIYIKHKNKIYNISPYNKSTQMQSVFESILSSFRFI